MAIGKILCLCLGNSDRSPVMAAVLSMYLRNAGHDVICESAGISDGAKQGCASSYAVTAMKRIGIDLSNHCRKHISELKLEEYDLFVVVNDEVAGRLYLDLGVDMKKMFNAQITNPWPCQFQEDYDSTAYQVMAGMYKVVARYFPPE